MSGLPIAAALLVVGVLLHRDLVTVSDRLDKPGLRSEVQRDLDQLWHDVVALHGDYAKPAGVRLQDVETVVAELQHRQNETAKCLNWMASWIDHWARSTDSNRR